MNKPVVLCDVDGVLADFASAFLTVVNDLAAEAGKDAFGYDDITSFDFKRTFGEWLTAEAWRVWHGPRGAGMVLGLGEIPGALEGLQRLRGHARVVAVTAPAHGPRWCYERTEWLTRRGFDPRDIVFASDKSLVLGDALIDDHHVNLTEWSAVHSGYKMLVDQPWNQDTGGVRMVRRASVADAVEHLIWCLGGEDE